MNNNVIRNMNNKNPQCRTWESSSLAKMSKENTPYVPQVLCFFLSAFALLGSPQTCPSSSFFWSVSPLFFFSPCHHPLYYVSLEEGITIHPLTPTTPVDTVSASTTCPIQLARPPTPLYGDSSFGVASKQGAYNVSI